MEGCPQCPSHLRVPGSPWAEVGLRVLPKGPWARSSKLLGLQTCSVSCFSIPTTF